MSEHVLLTGATGLLGRYLLLDLLSAGHQVSAIARAQDDQAATTRIDAIMREWESVTGQVLPRPVCFAGDVCQEALGLSEKAREFLSQNARSVLHNAAIVSFDKNADGDPARTNVGGTEQTLAACRQLDIREFHYVSTAYVCGFRHDLVKEDELDRGQTFRNAYEESKFRAETLVRQAGHLDKITVYRPAVIAGDSKTGYTYTYHGIYHYLKLISLMARGVEPGQDGRRHTPVRLDMTGEEHRNVVPVDWVSQVISELFSNPQAHGKTFHLSPDVPLTPREIIEAGYNYFNSYGVEFCGTAPPPCPPPSANGNGEMKENWRSYLSVYQNYEQSDPQFDTTNLKAFAPHLPCPRIDESMLHRYWKFGEQDNWGRNAAPMTAGV